MVKNKRNYNFENDIRQMNVASTKNENSKLE